MSSQEDKEDLLSEKSLFRIYQKYRRLGEENKFNFFATLAGLAFFTINSFASVTAENSLIKDIEKISETGINLSLGFLGFLLAGFTIFVTISESDLLLSMSGIQKKSKRKKDSFAISYLKYYYFGSIQPFIFILLFSVFCLLINFTAKNPGLVAYVIKSLAIDPVSTKINLLKMIQSVTYAFYLFIILQIKTFVFNIYHTSMATLKWAELKKQKSADEENDV